MPEFQSPYLKLKVGKKKIVLVQGPTNLIVAQRVSTRHQSRPRARTSQRKQQVFYEQGGIVRAIRPGALPRCYKYGLFDYQAKDCHKWSSNGPT